jgi:HAD superfamily hydrolase (TIGR01509 family)
MMIKVVLFDLGMTLVDAQQKPFAHVPEALAVIQGLHTAAGKPLRSALVSDFDLVAPPPTPAKVAPVFAQYLALLTATGLRDFFEPTAKRVTLSTHAGVMKPARAVFDKALSRLQIKASLAECLFITEAVPHIAAARALGLHTLRFASPGAPHATTADFSDWSQAPALVAHLLGATSDANLHAAIGAHLKAQGVDVADVQPGRAAHEYQARGHTWHTVAVPGHPALQAVKLAVPLQAQVTRGPRGALHVQLPATDPAAVAEATAFVASLAAHGQIEGLGATASQSAATSAPTHQLQTDASGACKLVRKRFTAF